MPEHHDIPNDAADTIKVSRAQLQKLIEQNTQYKKDLAEASNLLLSGVTGMLGALGYSIGENGIEGSVNMAAVTRIITGGGGDALRADATNITNALRILVPYSSDSSYSSSYTPLLS